MELIVTWFGLGRLKPGPGTWGTLGAIPLVVLFNFLGPMGYLVATFVSAVGAILACHFYQQTREGHDHQEIVIDEVVGFCVTMAWVPLTLPYILAGFVLFRLLDILKPPPISWADKKIKGGVGVVADDLIAGIIANMILQASLSYF